MKTKLVLTILLLVLLSVGIPAPARAEMAEYTYIAPSGFFTGNLVKFIPGGFFNFSGMAPGLGLVLDRQPRGFAALSLYWRGACVNIPGQFDGWIRLGRDVAGGFQVDFYINGDLIDNQYFVATPGKADQVFKFDVRRPWDAIMFIFAAHPSRYVQVLGVWGARK